MTRTIANGPILPFTFALAALVLAPAAQAKIGDAAGIVETPEVATVRGIALDPATSKMYALDAATNDIVEYDYADVPAGGTFSLTFVRRIAVPPGPAGRVFQNARGLAVATEGSSTVLYSAIFNTADPAACALWRFDLTANASRSIPLAPAVFGLESRPIVGVGVRDGLVHLSYETDPADPADYTKGILRFRVYDASGATTPFDDAKAGAPAEVKHLPNLGRKAGSWGLAFWNLPNRSYIFGTAEGSYIYAAEADTGRAIFQLPPPLEPGHGIYGLTFGYGWLFIADYHSSVPERIVRVVVTTDLFEPAVGTKRVRTLVMDCRSTPVGNSAPLGWGYVRHNFCVPYAEDVFPSQDIDPESIVVTPDPANPSAALLSELAEDIALDPDARQKTRQARYTPPNGPAPGAHATSFEVTYWTRTWRQYVYPHRTGTNDAALAGTSYLADDNTLYNLWDVATYDAFIARVEDHIRAKYGIVDTKMTSPYWASRNILEYIREHYYYPNDALGFPNTHDRPSGHFPANPANLKLALSDGPYDQDELISCSPASVMMVGALRHLGFHARWIGSTHDKNVAAADLDGNDAHDDEWDLNGDGIQSLSEEKLAENGHRWAQVWVGPSYGWITVDATPSTAPDGDYLSPPPAIPQWKLLDAHASNQSNNATRLIHNIGSGKYTPTFWEYEPLLDEGGDQRYNVEQTYTYEELWEGRGGGTVIRQACWFYVYTTWNPPFTRTVHFSPFGRWDLDPDSKVDIVRQKLTGPGGDVVETVTVATDLDWDEGSYGMGVLALPSGWYRVKVQKVGDPTTGGSVEFYQ